MAPIAVAEVREQMVVRLETRPLIGGGELLAGLYWVSDGPYLNAVDAASRRFFLNPVLDVTTDGDGDAFYIVVGDGTVYVAFTADEQVELVDAGPIALGSER